LAGGDFNSKHTLWGSRLITTKGRELAKTIQTKNYSYISIGSPTYWPTDTNKTPDLLDFFITNGISTDYADVEASYDLTSDHSPIIATISTTVMIRQSPPRLHTSHTQWKTYKTIIRDNEDHSPKLKTSEDIEIATKNFISTLQQADYLATPKRTPLRTSSTLPLDIRRMVAIKRRARATWQKTHAPDDRCLYNKASNKLKTALRNLQNDWFANYVSTLKRDDNSVWKPIRSRKKLQTPLQIRKNTLPPGPWAKNDTEKAELLANHLAEVFTQHNNSPDQEVER
jgi:hypothetical protein